MATFSSLASIDPDPSVSKRSKASLPKVSAIAELTYGCERLVVVIPAAVGLALSYTAVLMDCADVSSRWHLAPDFLLLFLSQSGSSSLPFLIASRCCDGFAIALLQGHNGGR